MPRIILCVLLALYCSTGLVWSDIIYDPLYVVIYAPNGKGYGSINITNPTDQPLRMQIDFMDFELGADQSVTLLREKTDSISRYLKVSPRQFTLQPSERRVVRIAAALPDSLPNNHEYHIFLSMTEIGQDRKIISTQQTDAGQSSYGLIINKSMNAGTYIRKGNPTDFKAELQYSNFAATLAQTASEAGQLEPIVNCSFNVLNTGNKQARRSIGIKLYDEADRLVYEQRNVDAFISFAENPAQSVQTSFPFPDDKLMLGGGQYKLEFILQDNSTEATSGQGAEIYYSDRITLQGSTNATLPTPTNP